MKKLFIVINILFIFTIPYIVYSDTRTAASCNNTTGQLDVKDAVDAASSGDTVIVPAGACTWDTTLTITVGITLQGAGVDVTTITGTGTTRMITYQPATPALNEPFRITGFTFNGQKAIAIVNTSHTATITKIRIDHNKMLNGAAAQIFFDGMIYGLVDNNNLNGNGIFYLSGDDNYSWNNSISPGTADYIYIENNIISGNTDWYITQTNEGARWVFRYNTVNLANHGDPPLDAHGNQSSDISNIPTSCALTINSRGVLGIEVYENTFTNKDNVARLVDLRGGTGYIYNNTMTGSSNASSSPITLREEDNDALGGCYPLKETYPGYDPMVNTYVWNNIINGGPTSMDNQDSELMIIEQQEYWADTQDGGVSATTYFTKNVGASRNLTTCTAQDVYWETDNKRLYRCTSTNTWTLIYTPYDYPHPLQYTSSARGVSLTGGSIQ